MRLRAGTTTDSYDATVKDWSDPDEEDIAGVAVAPRLAPEDTADGREGVPIGLTLYAPAGSDITARDRVVVRGVTYEVDGEVAEWVSPYSGSQPGIEVALKRFEG